MKNILIQFISITFMFHGCTPEEEVGTQVNDLFFLSNERISMPVFVRGNTASEVFIVYLHGGPGSTSLEAYQREASPFTQLQEDYAVVYWEQRCGGISQGNCDYNELELADYTQDLEKLIILLKDRYDTDIRIFLLGHSWGGSLGIQFLSQGNNQALVKGWIEVGGGHNVPRISELERAMVNEVGQRQIDLGNEVATWQEYIRQANALNLSDTDDVFEMNRIARRSETLMVRVDSVNEQIDTSPFADYFFSPLDIAAITRSSERTLNAVRAELAALNLTPNTRTIRIPTLLLWGRYDFRVPPEFGVEAFENYGSVNKEFILFERSAHFVQWNEPDRFREVVKGFVERYR